MFSSSQIKDNRLLIRASPAFYFKISESSSGLFIYCFFFLAAVVILLLFGSANCACTNTGLVCIRARIFKGRSQLAARCRDGWVCLLAPFLIVWLFHTTLPSFIFYSQYPQVAVLHFCQHTDTSH